MKACVVIGALYFISWVSALPFSPNGGMVYYQMPYYSPYHQAMLVHYGPKSFGRSAGSSAFAAGDAIAAGTAVQENHVLATDTFRATAQEVSTNDGNVEAIAEAYPEEPVQGTVQFDQGEEQYNEVLPLNAGAPVSEIPVEATENIAPVVPLSPEPAAELPQPQVQPTTVASKKKVHIALDIPDKNDENQDDNDDDQYPYVPQKPGKKSKNDDSSPVYTFFPVSFGRAAGGSIAVANAYSTGKGAVRSHAIAYGSNVASRRQQATERHFAAQKYA